MSEGVTLPISIILSTRVCGVGTHTTSLPGWPEKGLNGLAGCCASPMPATSIRARPPAAARERPRFGVTFIQLLLYADVASASASPTRMPRRLCPGASFCTLNINDQPVTIKTIECALNQALPAPECAINASDQREPPSVLEIAPTQSSGSSFTIDAP